MLAGAVIIRIWCVKNYDYLLDFFRLQKIKWAMFFWDTVYASRPMIYDSPHDTKRNIEPRVARFGAHCYQNYTNLKDLYWSQNGEGKVIRLESVSDCVYCCIASPHFVYIRQMARPLSWCPTSCLAADSLTLLTTTGKLTWAFRPSCSVPQLVHNDQSFTHLCNEGRVQGEVDYISSTCGASACYACTARYCFTKFVRPSVRLSVQYRYCV